MNVAILRSSTLQKAISVHDFKEQVKEMYSPDDPIPSDKLVRLQFVPVHKSASKYTSFLEVKKKVQQCQWRMDHGDSHYCACIFRYMKEYASLFHEHAVIACLDDKHKVRSLANLWLLLSVVDKFSCAHQQVFKLVIT